MKLEELLEMKTAYETAFWRNEDYDGADCLDGFINRYGEVLYEAMKELEKYLKRGKRMNRMKEVAKLKGVSLNEEFKIMGFIYKFTLKGLEDGNGCICNHVLKKLLTGELQIEKLPFKPKYDDGYYWVSCVGKINSSTWHYNTQDYCLFNVGNCFRTSEEISVDDIDRIVKEMKVKYEGVEE